jgi:hypothetical protein
MVKEVKVLFLEAEHTSDGTKDCIWQSTYITNPSIIAPS